MENISISQVKIQDINLDANINDQNLTRLEKQEIIFRKFKELSDPESIVNNEGSREMIMQTITNVALKNQQNHIEYINLSLKYNFTAVLIRLLNKTYERIKETGRDN